MKNQFYANQPQRHHQRLIDEESELESSQDFLQSMNFMLPEIPIDQEKSKVQHQVIIENTPVFFPHSPYNVQIEYMKNVIQSLDKKQNALLESPTGTGKTLSTLCASLAWLKKYRENQNIERGDKRRYFKIIYSSRTHAQLKQVAQELKKTVYQPNVAMLGSRDQYCIRGDLNKMKGIVLNQICKKAIKSNRCMFYQKDQLNGLAYSHLKLLHSLEEAKQFGYKNKCCPYYFERERLQYADLIMLPYNYLLDKNFMNIAKIENSIIIFDEAHNVQNTAQDGSSFSISQNDAIEAQNDLKRWIEELESPLALVKLEFTSLIFNVSEYKSILMTIKMFANFLEEKKIQIQAQSSDYENEKFQIKQGRDIFEIIKKAEDKQTGSIYEKGLYSENLKIYLNHCQDLVKIMSEHSSTQGNHFEAWTKFIENICDLMQCGIIRKSCNQYKLAFKLDSLNQLSLQMWCLDPSPAFNRLIEKGIYSIILTSGTLAPFQSWACELRVDFPICLQSKHIIDISKNLRVFQHKSFDFSFQQRNNEEQINKLGISLLNLCRVIPNGILVIFSSYSLMNKLRSKWTYSKILLRIQEIKACLWEPKQTAEMQNVFEMYKQKANKGAIMFAVQRGKVAEGIDFSDELCRAVFLIGVPYPPKTDQKLIQKMGYLDQVYVDPEFNQQQRLKSSEWYTQQAIRATNQALGRVIRHVNDYGVVFLCDKRFEYGDVSRGLSEWVKPAVQPWLNDDEIIKKTQDFYKRNPSNYIQQQQQYGENQVKKQREEQQSQSSHFVNLSNRNIPEQSTQLQSQRKQPIQLKQDFIKSSSGTKQQTPQIKPQYEHQQPKQQPFLLGFFQQKSLYYQRKQSYSESLDDSNDEEPQLSNEKCENPEDSNNQESQSASEMFESQDDPNDELEQPTPEDSFDEQPSSDNPNESDEWQQKKKQKYNYPFKQ